MSKEKMCQLEESAKKNEKRMSERKKLGMRLRMLGEGSFGL